MPERKFVRPAPGRRVRDPDHGGVVVPEAGIMVNWSAFWHRRLVDGDVVVVDPPPPDAVEEAPPDAGEDEST